MKILLFDVVKRCAAAAPLVLATFVLTALTGCKTVPPLSEAQVYEMRTYYAAPGKLDELHARVRDHTRRILERHGVINVGFWVPLENPDNKLIFALAYPNQEARDRSWERIMNDLEWTTLFTASRLKGKLVERSESVLLVPTDYSPLPRPSTGGQPRVFELRTYKAAPGKQEALNSRFRNHTLGLFSKHGMTHICYWTPAGGEPGADDTLVYILAHKSREAAQNSFKAFREDPAWIAAKTESERDGSLTLKVESLFLKPTDYSPIR